MPCPFSPINAKRSLYAGDSPVGGITGAGAEGATNQRPRTEVTVHGNRMSRPSWAVICVTPALDPLVLPHGQTIDTLSMTSEWRVRDACVPVDALVWPRRRVGWIFNPRGSQVCPQWIGVVVVVVVNFRGLFYYFSPPSRIFRRPGIKVTDTYGHLVCITVYFSLLPKP